MGVIIGFVLVLVMVFGGFVAAGGNFDIIMSTIVFELIIILGGAIGAYVIANRGYILKHTMADIKKAMKGSKFDKKDYVDLLSLLYEIVKLSKAKGLIAVEAHIENPKESDIFSKYPKILNDHFAVYFICDTFRMITMSLEDPYQIEDNMEKQIEKHHHEAAHGAHALQTMAEGLPAIGIVAAVLGVIKTMGHVDAEVVILGKMIGGALVGTFLGVFLSYMMIGPIASRLSEILEEEAHYYHIIRDVMVGMLHGQAAQVAIEVGRGNVPSRLQPSFFELEEALESAVS